MNFDAADVANWTRTLNELASNASQIIDNNNNDNLKILRDYYKQILECYPSSACLWYSWMQFEWLHGHFEELEGLFAKALRPYGTIKMWLLYLKYVLMANSTTSADLIDVVLERRQVINKAFELALSHVGLDLHSLPIHSEYLSFVHSWNTTSLYEQQVQMDAARKIYHRALALPLLGLESIWHDFDIWENKLNKLTATKILSDRSALYMAARSKAKELQETLCGLDFDEYAVPPSEDPSTAAQKCAQWMRWVKWEELNSINLPEKSQLIIQRIQYAYKKILTVLAKYPEIWNSYSSWLRSVGKREEAEAVLVQGLSFVPLSPLLHFARVDLLEEMAEVGTLKEEERQKAHETCRKVQEEFILSIESKIEETSNNNPEISQILTLANIQLMNYCRRSDGIASARAIFTKARKHASIGSALFIAAAEMEFYCKKDSIVAGRIFELGLARFPNDCSFIQSYLKHLLRTNDEQNARSLFERTVVNLPSSEESLEIWKLYLDHAFKYGDNGTIAQLRNRMQKAFPSSLPSNDLIQCCRKYSWWDDNGVEIPIGTECLWLWLEKSMMQSPLIEDLTDVTSSYKTEYPKVWIVEDAVFELLSKLKPDINIPTINFDLLLKCIVQAAPSQSVISSIMQPVPVSQKRSVSHSSKISAQSSIKKRRNYQLEDEDDKGNGGASGRSETVIAPVRHDDIFAVRRRAK